MSFKTIILAAGKGTRMKSKKAKVLHEVCGKPMVNHIIDVSKLAGSKETIVITGHMKDEVLKALDNDIKIAEQKERLGTGHAVMMCKDFINDDDKIMILCGDTPLLNEETLKNLLDYHNKNSYKATVLTCIVENSNGYGRIIRDDKNNLLKIVEQKDASMEELLVKEINSGIYIFDGLDLKIALDKIDNNNAQGEYYLTDTLELIKNDDKSVGAFSGALIEEIMGVNSKLDLSKANEIMRRKINENHMLEGVIIVDTTSTYIDLDVKIGMDTIIEPNVILKGNTVIGEDCIIGANSKIIDSRISDDVKIENSTVLESNIDSNTTVGPYAYIRPNCNIGKNVKIGDFVEVKNSNIDDNTKASHLTYIGDANLGKGINLGCGVVFVNYDGKNKFRTTVEDNSFIGCNTNLIAPVKVEENSYIAAGSTITDDVPKNNLAIARARQVNKDNWKKN